MNYWLMKSEPGTFSIDDLKAMPNQTDHWDGVRNYQARNMMRDQMLIGDRVLFYHSNCATPGIIGLAFITSAPYPDHTAFDPESRYFDPKSREDNPRWYMVDVRYERHLARPISIVELREYPQLEGMQLLRKGNRLSITPVSQEHWSFILDLETLQPPAR